jgi:hypothetical protein
LRGEERRRRGGGEAEEKREAGSGKRDVRQETEGMSHLVDYVLSLEKIRKFHIVG